MERSSYRRFFNLVSRGLMHAMPTMLTGDVVSGGNYLVLGNFEPLAEKKVQNFTNFAQLYPEYRHVFCGDNGATAASRARTPGTCCDESAQGKAMSEPERS
jgi:hypothetical protein